MAQGIPRALMNLVMAATVLAWGIAPPPVEHSHHGGADLSHHHNGCDAGRAGAEIFPRADSVSDCGEPRSATLAAKGIGGEASHLHFQWLGFRLTLPDDDSPTKKGEDRCGSKLLFVQASRASLSQVYSGNGLDTSLTILALNAIAADGGASCSPVLCSLLRLTPHPLCDRARDERSGVQLA